MKLYRIKNWSDYYENNRTRDLKRLAWVPLPNNHDSDGYTILVERKNGAALFGAWVALVQVASRCGLRGTLMRSTETPHNSASLERITRIPAEIFEEMLKITEFECKWVESEEVAEIPQEGAVTPLPHPAGGCLEGKERKKGTEPCAGDSELPLFPTAEDIYQAYPKHVAKADAIKAIQKAMKKVEPQRLLDAVTAYAKAVAGSDAQFIPYPASWFNSERYSDDPKTWGRSEPKQPEAKQPYNPIL